MNLLNPGVHVLGFYNAADGTKAFMSGNDISPSSSLEKSVLTRGVSSGGGTTQLNYKWELNLQFARKEAFDDLIAFSKNQGSGLEIWKTNGFVTWRELGDVYVDEAVVVDPGSEDYPYTARMSFTGPDPYIKESLNYLAPWNGIETKEWGISGNYTTLSFSNGLQTVNTEASGSIKVYTDVYHPFRDGAETVVPDIDFALWANVGTIPTGADIAGFAEVYDANDQFSIETSGNTISSSGDQEIVKVGPGSTNLRARVGFRIDNLTEVTSFTFSDPYILTDRAANNSGLTSEFTNY